MSSPEYYVFTLYVADRSEDSLKIYERLAALCFRHLASKHVINLCDLAELGNGGGKYRVTTTPGVLGRMPEPLSRFIENLSFDEKYFLKVERAD